MYIHLHIYICIYIYVPAFVTLLICSDYRVAKTHRMPKVAGHIPKKTHYL